MPGRDRRGSDAVTDQWHRQAIEFDAGPPRTSVFSDLGAFDDVGAVEDVAVIQDVRAAEGDGP
jgi:hypothetical protein